MTTERIRVGIIGASMRTAGRATPTFRPCARFLSFEITAVSTSRQETAGRNGQAFRIPTLLLTLTNGPASRRGPRLDLRACLFTISWDGRVECRQASLLRMAAVATTEQAQQMRVIWPHAKGCAIWWDSGLRGSRVQSRQRPCRRGLRGACFPCTMIITTPAWGTEFTRDWAYMADRRTAIL